jgi:hypothetical protein
MNFTQRAAGLFPSHASHALSSISKGEPAAPPQLHPRRAAPTTSPPHRPNYIPTALTATQLNVTKRFTAGLHRGIPTVPWKYWLADLHGSAFSTQLDHYMDSAMLNAKEVEARMHALWHSLSAFGISGFSRFNMDNQRCARVSTSRPLFGPVRHVMRALYILHPHSLLSRHALTAAAALGSIPSFSKFSLCTKSSPFTKSSSPYSSSAP